MINEQIQVSSICSCSQVKQSFVTNYILALHHKIRIGIYQLRERGPGRPDGTEDDKVCYVEDLQFAYPLKIPVAGQTDSAIVASVKYQYGSVVASPDKNDAICCAFSLTCGRTLTIGFLHFTYSPSWYSSVKSLCGRKSDP